VGGSIASRHAIECAHGGEFQKMQVGEIIFAPSDNGGIDDAVPDHLDGAVECDQGGRAGCGNGKTGTHEAIAIADEAGRCAVESTQERGVIRGQPSGLHLPFDGARLFR